LREGRALNTYDLQRLIRDDSSLNAGEVAVLLILTTYLPHAAPSVEAIARGCRMNAKSVRRIIKRLDGRWIRRQMRPGKPTIYAFHPPIERPSHQETLPSRDQGSLDTRHPPIERPPEETNKRETVNNTSLDTKSRARDRLQAWREVWSKVAGGPLPTLEELHRVRPGMTEAYFSSCLGEVASARAAGSVKSPRSLFFAKLKATAGQPPPASWDKASVLDALSPLARASAPDMRRPDLQAPTITPPLVETPEQRADRRASARMSLEAVRASLKETS
jgi:hypothetical protein